MRWITPLAALLCLLAFGASSASATIQAYNEPQFTKTSGNNAYFWHWVAQNGSDENGNTVYTYYLCFATYRDGVQVESSNGTTGGPGSSNCTGTLRSGPTPSSGDFAGTPFTTGTVLDDGHSYQMCANGFYRWPYLPWKLDAANNGNCASTTIDRNKPAIGVFVDGTADYTNDPVLQVRIDYQDATSPPWNGSSGVASNWVCVNRGATCTPGGSPSEPCSHPANASSRTTSFTCTADATSQPDGDWNVCAMAADSAVPDNTSGTNQFAQATSNNANISTPLCGHVVLDRVAPVVTASAGQTSVKAGDLVTFAGSATDATSGVSGAYDWDFGDNTQHGSGSAPTHTYTQPGTYVAKAATKDGAGNDGTGTVTITVAPAPASPAPTTTTTGTSTTPAPTPSAPSGPAAATSSGGASVTPAPTAAAISQQAGGGGTQNTRAGGLSIVAPKKLTLTATRKKLPLVLTASAPGTAEVSLLRGARIVAKGSAKITRAGTLGFSLKLPVKRQTGTHTLKIVFRPASGAATTKTLRITFVKAKTKASRRVALPLVGIPLAG